MIKILLKKLLKKKEKNLPFFDQVEEMKIENSAQTLTSQKEGENIPASFGGVLMKKFSEIVFKIF